MNWLERLISKVFEWFGAIERTMGRDRQVFVFKDKVIKIPHLKCWYDVIRGWNSNLKEVDTITRYDGYHDDHLPEIIHSLFGGLIIVMKRYQEVKEDPVHIARFRERLERLKELETPNFVFVWGGDNKSFNYGWDKYGRLVKFDLGTFY